MSEALRFIGWSQSLKIGEGFFCVCGAVTNASRRPKEYGMMNERFPYMKTSLRAFFSRVVRTVRYYYRIELFPLYGGPPAGQGL